VKANYVFLVVQNTMYFPNGTYCKPHSLDSIAVTYVE